MLRGLYSAASGMLTQQHHIDILSNNLANINTNGYRADRMLVRAFPDILLHRVNDGPANGPAAPRRSVPIGRLGTGAFVEGTALVVDPGPYQYTGNPLDVAIAGEGFFLVQTPAGERLTRDGSFRLDAEGWLVTQDGQFVLGTGGAPVQIVQPGAAPGPVRIDEAGRVWVGQELRGTLAIVNVPQPAALAKEGGNRLVVTEASGGWFPVAGARLEPGHLEGSNVQVVAEMVRIISGFRAYEAAQRAVQAHDELLDRSVNEVGRV